MDVDEAVGLWVGAWNEADAATRAVLLESAVTEDCVYVGPTGTVEGRAAILAAIAEARDFMPGASVVRLGPAYPEAGGVRFAWEVRGPSGEPVLAGVDAVEVASDGRLVSVVVLPGPSG